MVVCWLIGLIVGTIAQRTVRENIETYKKEHPLPDSELLSEETEGEELTSTEESAESKDVTRPAA